VLAWSDPESLQCDKKLVPRLELYCFAVIAILYRWFSPLVATLNRDYYKVQTVLIGCVPVSPARTGRLAPVGIKPVKTGGVDSAASWQRDRGQLLTPVCFSRPESFFLLENFHRKSLEAKAIFTLIFRKKWLD